MTPAQEVPAGVPLGGVGAGCLEMGRDGRFRNITINNNRTAAERIALAEKAFLAVRTAQGDNVRTRILQSDVDLPFGAAKIQPSFTSVERLNYKGLYPLARYELPEGEFPIGVSWKGVAPILPFDIEASRLPMIMIDVRLTNPSDAPCEAAAMFNWENLRGCTASLRPAARGRAKFIAMDEDKNVVPRDFVRADDTTHLPLGLAFALDDPCASNAEGNTCIAATCEQGVSVTSMTWAPDDPQALQTLWTAFREDGALPNRLDERANAHCGAVCASCVLQPRQTRRLTFFLAWYCPVFRQGDTNIGNGYTNHFNNAVEVAEYGLEYHKILISSVKNWQTRFHESSLPTWYSKMLLNSASVFSTNTIYTADEQLYFFESPEDGQPAVLDRDFYTSFATLLFYPSFAHQQLMRWTSDAGEGGNGALYRSLGGFTGNAPEPNELIENPAKAVLMAYRNFAMTGNLARLQEVHPRLTRILVDTLNRDYDRDGLPEGDADSTMFPDLTYNGISSYVAGLWIGAYKALGVLSRRLRQKEDAERLDHLAQRATAEMHQWLWPPNHRYFKFAHDTQEDDEFLYPDQLLCHVGQVIGLWYQELLHIAPAEDLPPTVRQALNTSVKVLSRENGVLLHALPPEIVLPPGTDPPSETSLSWPYLGTVPLAAALIQQGDAQQGLDLLKTVFRTIHHERRRMFNAPLTWHTETNEPTGPGQDRHIGPLAMWHTLYALEGFFLNVPEERLHVAPNLPGNVDYLRAPIFTPVCLGELIYHVTREGGYQQSIKVSFANPVTIRKIYLRAPSDLTNVIAYLGHDGDAMGGQCLVDNTRTGKIICLDLQKSIRVHDHVAITLREKALEPVAAASGP